jgi:hypothetical protein
VVKGRELRLLSRRGGVGVVVGGRHSGRGSRKGVGVDGSWRGRKGAGGREYERREEGQSQAHFEDAFRVGRQD